MGLCAGNDCDRKATRKGFCQKHYVRWHKHGDPEANHNKKPGPKPNYLAMHKRIWRLRGPARTHLCPCGQQAYDWAYLHNDPNEIIGPWATTRPQLMTYSLDPALYIPLCRRCHTRMDHPDWSVSCE